MKLVRWTLDKDYLLMYQHVDGKFVKHEDAEEVIDEKNALLKEALLNLTDLNLINKIKLSIGV